MCLRKSTLYATAKWRICSIHACGSVYVAQSAFLLFARHRNSAERAARMYSNTQCIQCNRLFFDSIPFLAHSCIAHCTHTIGLTAMWNHSKWKHACISAQYTFWITITLIVELGANDRLFNLVRNEMSEHKQSPAKAIHRDWSTINHCSSIIEFDFVFFFAVK